MNTNAAASTLRFTPVLFCFVASLVVGFLTPMSANCARVTIAITATVTVVDDFNNILNASIAVGDTIRGSYSYDSIAVDSNPLPQVGDYYYTTAPSGVRLTVNGLNFRTDPSNVAFLLELVDNYLGRDNYVWHSYNNLFDISATGMFVSNHLDFQLDDPTQTAISSPALPKNPPRLSDWTQDVGLNITSSGDNGSFFIRATVTSAVRGHH